MSDIENIIEKKAKLNDDIDKTVYERQKTIESAITAETHEEKNDQERHDENILTNETITSIHTFVFDILAFFSNVQPSLIVEYCQETQNVCNEYMFLLFESRISIDYLFQWNQIQRFFNDDNVHILPVFFCDFQERTRFSKRSSISKYLAKKENIFYAQ